MKYFILWSLLIVSLARAQDADTVKNYQLEGTTVTATRTPVSVYDVPIAVSVLGRSTIENQRGYGLDQALLDVPGVLAQSRSGNHDIRIAIRGYGARGSGDRSNAGTSRGIRVLLDGMPMTEPDGRTAFDLVDMNSVETLEIVRSNASSTWGNAGGGVISLSTVPTYDESFVRLQSKLGSFGLSEYHLKSGFRVNQSRIYGSMTKTDFDGWRKHSESERLVANLGVVTPLAERTVLSVHAIGAINKFNIPGPLTQAAFDTNAKQANPTYLAREERRYNRLLYLGTSLEHDISDRHHVSAMGFVNPKFLQRSERGTFRDFTRYHLGGNLTYRNTRRFDETKNVFLAGVDEAYQDGAILFYPLLNGERAPGNPMDDKREGANNLGFFAHDEVHLGNWIVMAGLRYDAIKYYNQNFLRVKPGLTTKTYSHVTPKAGITYRFSEEHSVYANLGGGVEVPAGNETDPSNFAGLQSDTTYGFNPLLKPITSVSTEAGTKQRIVFENDGLFRQIRYDAAVYMITSKNDLVPFREGRFYIPAGETRRMGLEWASTIGLAHGFDVSANLTVSKNTYVKYSIDSVYLSAAQAGKSTRFDDNELAGVPDLMYKIGGRYNLGMLNGIYIELHANGMGSYYADAANTVKVPSYTILNATIGLGKPIKISNDLSLQGFFAIQNLTDKRYAGSAFINPDPETGTNAPKFLEPGLPRNFVLSVSLNWQ